MKKFLALLVGAFLLAGLAGMVGCGGKQKQGSSNAPSEKEVGAPVYPGARYTGAGLVKGTYKYASEDSSKDIVDWYREELKGKSGFKETNSFAEATTGDAISYTEGDKTFWITVLPGLEGLPTTIDISANASLAPPPTK